MINENNVINNFIWNKTNNYTASYIYCIYQNNIYFALGRKVPNNSRKRISGPNKGAAGTNKIYWGKWVSFGGKKENLENSDIREAISEINDESNIYKIQNELSLRNDVFVPNKQIKDNTQIKDNNQILELKKAFNEKDIGISIFLFEIRDPDKFFEIYPNYPKHRRSPKIVESSKGEIDSVCSFTIEQMIRLQNSENNFFTNYFCKSFNSLIIQKFLINNPIIKKKEEKKN